MKAQTRILFLVTIVALLFAGLGVGAMIRTAAAQAGPVGGTWVTETVQTSATSIVLSSRSLVLDGYGRPHAAFGGDHLYYASYADGQWHTELIDPQEGTGAYAYLVLDAGGYPHIAYRGENGRGVKYAAYDGANWRIEQVAGEADIRAITGLALDPSGRPQLTYYAGTTFMLAWYDGSDWHTAAMDDILGGASCCGTMVLDSGGRPHLAFYSGGLKYAYVRDDAWHVEMVDPNPYPGNGYAPITCGPASLVLDAEERPHIAYCQSALWGYGSVRYARHDGWQWHIENVSSEFGYDLSLALDPTGRPRLSYSINSTELTYAYLTDLGWQFETLAHWSHATSLALDPTGRPHILYMDDNEYAIKYTYVLPPTFADPAFERVWQRTDRPIAEGVVARSWMWGPRPLTAAAFEPYADAPGGSRLVQYYDKARMEINDPNGDRSSQWFVTNGLLVREMVSGWLQVGNDEFEWRGPAGEAVAGDPVAGNPNCPLYGTLNGLIDQRAGDRTGQPVTATLARDGAVSDDPSKAAYPGTEIAYYAEATGHNVPQALWSFMNQRGPVYKDGHYRNDTVVDWLFAMGYPISEPYWVRCTVAGQEKDVLVQLFERRVLTYTPSNPAGWQVEMGNVGRHYYTWRYGIEP